MAGELPGLQVDRIDPVAETQALLLEDLQSPCTDEVAVFHAFSRVVNEARTTGSLLPLCATVSPVKHILHAPHFVWSLPPKGAAFHFGTARR